MDAAATVIHVIAGIVALLSAYGDARIMTGSRLTAGRRIVRHLWRMGIATFIATGPFFLGQAGTFPPQLRIMPLLASPPMAVLVVTLWFWAKRSRRAA